MFTAVTSQSSWLRCGPFWKAGANGGVPEGIVSGMIELKPAAKPVIYRNFIEGVTPRGIAAGYPERANLCWDANRMSLASLWQDRFIDAAKHWEGRGQGNQTPLGGSVTRFESVAPVAVLENLQSSWPGGSSEGTELQIPGLSADKVMTISLSITRSCCGRYSGSRGG